MLVNVKFRIKEKFVDMNVRAARGSLWKRTWKSLERDDRETSIFQSELGVALGGL